MALTPQFLRARALRYQSLAAKARREAGPEAEDPIAPRLIELAEKLECDAVRDDEEARALLEEQSLRRRARLPDYSGRLLPKG
jgi:hypothetical protein